MDRYTYTILIITAKTNEELRQGKGCGETYGIQSGQQGLSVEVRFPAT